MKERTPLDLDKPADVWRLLELCERASDGKLSGEEREFLEKTLKGNEKARVLFAKSLLQQAELRYDQSWAEGGRLQGVSVTDVAADEPKRGGSWWWFALGVLGLLVVAALVFGGRYWESEASGNGHTPAVATLTRSINGKWGGSTLPTAEGSRLGGGRLALLEGMAVVVFDSGAEVILEAPVILRLVDSMHCKLERGTLMVSTPAAAAGFTVEMPQAKVVDFGTRFGVSAGEDGNYLVKVLEGEVEVTTNAEPLVVKRLKGGESVDTGLRRTQLNPQHDGLAQESYRWQPNLIVDAGDGWQVISTAYGRGKDSYIQSDSKRNFGNDPFFRVKHSGIVRNLDRKGYVGFDVGRFDRSLIEDAELVLTIEPSDLGFASLVPDSTFVVYGVTAEEEDEWPENGLNWQNAPAHAPTQERLNEPDLTRAVKLGEFTIAQGGTGTRTLRCEKLTEFLRSDRNGLVTFIICRATAELEKDGLVHAFASKESRNNTPPLLRLKLGNGRMAQ